MGLQPLVVLGVATLCFAAAVGLTRFGYTLVLPGMQAGLGLSASEMGLIAGLALASYLCCSLPAGALATRFGTRPVVTAGLAASAAGLAATGLADGLAQAAAAQVVAGGAAAAVIVPVLSVAAAWFHPRHWGRAGGVVVGGGGLGILVSGLIVPALLGPRPSEGWRVAWFGLATCVLATGLIAGWLLRDPPGRLAGGRRPSLRPVLGNWSVWHLGLIFLTYGLAYVTYGTFFAAHLARQAELPPAEIGRLWSLSGVLGLGGGLIWGALADRLGPRRTLMMLFAAQGFSEASLALGREPWVLLLSALLYGLTVWSFAAIISNACAAVVGPALAPAAVSLAVLLMSVGQVSGPVLGGLLADLTGSFGPALLLATSFDVLGFLGSAALRLPEARSAR